MRALIDTSAWIEFFRPEGDPQIRQQVTEALKAKNAVLCDMVLLELYRGNAKQRKHVRLLESALPLLPTSDGVWARARKTATKLAALGKPVPNTIATQRYYQPNEHYTLR